MKQQVHDRFPGTGCAWADAAGIRRSAWQISRREGHFTITGRYGRRDPRGRVLNIPMPVGDQTKGAEE